MRHIEATEKTQAGAPFITLRGHHLLSLSYYLSTQPEPEEFFREEVTDDSGGIYGVDFHINTLRVFELVAAGNGTVKVSNSLDDLCSSCLNNAPSCSYSPFLDWTSAKLFGLRLNEYPAAKITYALKKNGGRIGLKVSPLLFTGAILEIVARQFSSLASSKVRGGEERKLPALTEQGYFEQIMAGYAMLKHQQNLL